VIRCTTKSLPARFAGRCNLQVKVAAYLIGKDSAGANHAETGQVVSRIPRDAGRDVGGPQTRLAVAIA
jgi:hypothetical protein